MWRWRFLLFDLHSIDEKCTLTISVSAGVLFLLVVNIASSPASPSETDIFSDACILILVSAVSTFISNKGDCIHPAYLANSIRFDQLIVSVLLPMLLQAPGTSTDEVKDFDSSAKLSQTCLLSSTQCDANTHTRHTHKCTHLASGFYFSSSIFCTTTWHVTGFSRGFIQWHEKLSLHSEEQANWRNIYRGFHLLHLSILTDQMIWNKTCESRWIKIVV